jgi:hypothetical protein
MRHHVRKISRKGAMIVLLLVTADNPVFSFHGHTRLLVGANSERAFWTRPDALRTNPSLVPH